MTQPSRTTESISRDNGAIREIMHQILDLTVPSNVNEGGTMVIPGHEFAGRVVEIDDDAADRWGIAVGDRVVSEQIVPCWECRFCRRGQYHMCQPHDLYGFKRRTPGAMASYMAYPAEALVHKVSGDITPQHAAFAEPLSCSLHAVGHAVETLTLRRRDAGVAQPAPPCRRDGSSRPRPPSGGQRTRPRQGSTGSSRRA